LKFGRLRPVHQTFQGAWDPQRNCAEHPRTISETQPAVCKAGSPIANGCPNGWMGIKALLALDFFLRIVSSEDFLCRTQRQKLGHVLSIRCFCTYFRCFFPGFALDFTAFPSFSFSFSRFFFHATATWKERSSSASEWSLGLTLKF